LNNNIIIYNNYNININININKMDYNQSFSDIYLQKKCIDNKIKIREYYIKPKQKILNSFIIKLIFPFKQKSKLV
jgi:hypothetical protein